jgi:hypothetical protein
MRCLTRMLPIAGALALCAALPAQADRSDRGKDNAVELVDDRRGRGWGPPPERWRGPPPRHFYGAPPRHYYAPPPRRYYAPPPPVVYYPPPPRYYAPPPPPGVGLYFRF